MDVQSAWCDRFGCHHRIVRDTTSPEHRPGTEFRSARRGSTRRSGAPSPCSLSCGKTRERHRGTHRPRRHWSLCGTTAGSSWSSTRFRQRWELPGGCIELGESPRQAATRGLLEESGQAPDEPLHFTRYAKFVLPPPTSKPSTWPCSPATAPQSAASGPTRRPQPRTGGTSANCPRTGARHVWISRRASRQ
ncbi:NUDIX domain-containing protein [Streptomyces uncialis]|uniref:NUDIX domain-containing protein n=1 Tax=Streptomyces uncialis TaxID=1048205 RepID=UPI0036541EAD